MTTPSGHSLDEASAGERFVIERDHKPLAVLVSVEDAADLEGDPDERRARRLAAVEALDQWAARYHAAGLTGDSEAMAADWVRADRDEHSRHRLTRHDEPHGASGRASGAGLTYAEAPVDLDSIAAIGAALAEMRADASRLAHGGRVPASTSEGASIARQP